MSDILATYVRNLRNLNLSILKTAQLEILYVAVADLGGLLLPFDDGVDDQVQQLLGAPVAQVQNPLAAEAVVDGKPTRIKGSSSARAVL